MYLILWSSFDREILIIDYLTKDIFYITSDNFFDKIIIS